MIPIPGFRSRTPWKMALAGFVYAVVLMVIVIAIINPSSETPMRDTSLPSASNEGLYRQRISTHSQEVGSTLASLGGLLQSPRLNDDEWRSAVAIQLIKLETLKEEAEAIEVPQKYTEVHGYYLLAMDEFAEVTRQLPKAIDDLDETLLETAMIHLDQGNKYVQQATQLLL